MTTVRARLATVKRRADFLRIANAGMKWGTAVLVVQAGKVVARDRAAAAPSAAASTAKPRAMPTPVIQVGFTASKKVGGAVERNRAKRRLRALARDVLPAEAKLGYDYVLIARPATVECDFATLRADLRFALRRLRLLRAAGAGEAAA